MSSGRPIFLSPHNDDETLFGAFSLLAHRPLVVVCYRSRRQAQMWGIHYNVRELETACAMDVLGCEWEQWTIDDDEADADLVVAELDAGMRELERRFDPSIVFAPLPLPEGNAQHDIVGELARDVFGDRVFAYSTYENGRGRHEGAVRVPYDPAWATLKLRALACYRSQSIRSTAHHFLTEQLEYLDRMPDR